MFFVASRKKAQREKLNNNIKNNVIVPWKWNNYKNAPEEEKTRENT